MQTEICTKDMVAECGHQLLEGVCTPPSTLQIFLLMRRRSGRRIPTAAWMGDDGEIVTLMARVLAANGGFQSQDDGGANECAKLQTNS